MMLPPRHCFEFRLRCRLTPPLRHAISYFDIIIISPAAFDSFRLSAFSFRSFFAIPSRQLRRQPSAAAADAAFAARFRFIRRHIFS